MSRSAATRMIAPLAILLLLVLIWQLYVDLGGIEPYILPSPTEIADAAVTDRSLLLDELLVTVAEVLAGIALAIPFATILAISLHLSRNVRTAFYPLLIASQAVPIVILAPLLVTWLGFGFVTKAVIVALVAFFPVAIATADGLTRSDADHTKLMRTLKASRWQQLRLLELPAALPSALSGVKIAVSIAVIGAVFAEQSGSSSGLGHLISQAIPQLETARAYAAVVLLAVFAVALFLVVGVVERRAVPWSLEKRKIDPGGSS